jgi:hypothetical protein
VAPLRLPPANSHRPSRRSAALAFLFEKMDSVLHPLTKQPARPLRASMEVIVARALAFRIAANPGKRSALAIFSRSIVVVLQRPPSGYAVTSGLVVGCS